MTDLLASLIIVGVNLPFRFLLPLIPVLIIPGLALTLASGCKPKDKPDASSTKAGTANHDAATGIKLHTEFYEGLGTAGWKTILIAADKGDVAAQAKLQRFGQILYKHTPDDGVDEIAFFKSMMNMREAEDEWLQELFPDIHPSKDPKAGETFGTKMFSEHRAPELVLSTLLREAEVWKMPAQLLLHSIYFSSVEGYQKYDKRILAYYLKTAAEGSPRAALELGIIYGLGLGVLKDSAKARSLLEGNDMIFDNADGDALSVLQNIYKEDGETAKLERLYKDAAAHGLKLTNP